MDVNLAEDLFPQGRADFYSSVVTNELQGNICIGDIDCAFLVLIMVWSKTLWSGRVYRIDLLRVHI